MKLRVAVVYPHIEGEEFHKHALRFRDTYHDYPAGCVHDLIIVEVGLCKPIPFQKMHFTEWLPNKGWDITIHQRIAKYYTDEYDFMVFFSSRTFFYREGWLERLVETRLLLGEGLYGSAYSFECSPHIRTCFFACNPKLFAQYPHTIATRKQARWFETGKWSFTKYFTETLKLPAREVLWDCTHGSYDGFRHGGQQQLLAFDKHSVIFSLAGSKERAMLTRAVHGEYNGFRGKFRKLRDVLSLKNHELV